MSNDAAQVERFALFFNFVWAAPLQVTAAIVLIVQQVGVATAVGVGFLVLLGPVNAVIFMKIGKLRRLVLKLSDERVKLMSELLNGVRIIKFCARRAARAATPPAF